MIDPWVEADRLAAERGGEPPSSRRFLVERIAWGVHVAGVSGLGSPRKTWAEMEPGPRAERYVEAMAAICVYEARVRDEPEEEAQCRLRIQD